MPLVVLDKTIDIACAPSRAYALLTEPWRAPAWQPWTPHGRARSDGAFALVHDVLGLRFGWIGRAEAEAESRVAFSQIAGDFERMEGAWEIAPLSLPGAEGARVRIRMRVALPFVLPRLLTEAEVSRALSTNLDEALYNLKSLLEGTPVARAGSGLPRASLVAVEPPAPPGVA